MCFRILNLCLTVLFICEAFSQSNNSHSLTKIPLKSHFTSEIIREVFKIGVLTKTRMVYCMLQIMKGF